MFRGTYEHAIDAKGRTSFPSKFRELLAAEGTSKLVVTTGLDACLVFYPPRVFKEFEAQLEALPQMDRAVRDMKRITLGNAQDVEVDAVGRLLIPSFLREQAKLKRDAVWSGNGKCVELWDKSTLHAMRLAITESEERLEAIGKRLAELGL